MIELKRCPFCGDEVEIVPTGLYHWKYAIHHKSKTECILDANAFALPYEEEDAIRMWNTRADRKDEPTISKMENVDEPQMGDAKPIPLSNRVTHIKDEPKTQMKTQNSNLTFEKRTMRDCYNCERYETEDECIECHYEPKDECAKEYEELGLKELKELIEADRKTEPSNIVMPKAHGRKQALLMIDEIMTLADHKTD